MKSRALPVVGCSAGAGVDAHAGEMVDVRLAWTSSAERACGRHPASHDRIVCRAARTAVFAEQPDVDLSVATARREGCVDVTGLTPSAGWPRAISGARRDGAGEAWRAAATNGNATLAGGVPIAPKGRGRRQAIYRGR